MPLKIIQNDPTLQEFQPQLIQRLQWFTDTLSYLEKDFEGLRNFAQGHNYFGFTFDKNTQIITFREWLPNAKEVYLIGEHNNWNAASHPLQKNEFGVWECTFSFEQLAPNSRIKLKITTAANQTLYKIPAYIQRVIQNQDYSFDAQVVYPSTYKWNDEAFEISTNFTPIIYECHIGMATEAHKVGTYTEFTQNVLPRIHKLGYNTIQLMAIQEHPYYASFGYQVSNFFAPSSRFGTPNELRELIDTAHQLGIAVVLDVVHSHMVKNEDESLSNQDGTEIYHNGTHPDWDSKLLKYEEIEVKRLLLSNLQYWMDEFHFDGFRFDGVTSMLYHHFGHITFDHYAKYFEHTNNDAILYLQLANQLIHLQPKNKISICEDMSGMPGACLPIADGGLGFDFRLAMGIPDYWMELLETTQDEDWQLGEMYWRLTNRRLGEKNIAYAESHDQALVGDKSIAFWLMDKEMYTAMSVFEESLIIDRGIALHKMIRFVTLLLGGEGYMNFMGNEFGHPEWVDFPREGNNNSYQYARRQWSLADADHLKYKFMNSFDAAMVDFVKKHNVLQPFYIQKLYEDNATKILAFSKNNLYFFFNFSKDTHLNITCKLYTEKTKLRLLFTSDNAEFGGYNRIAKSTVFSLQNETLKIDLPSRSVWVLG